MIIISHIIVIRLLFLIKQRQFTISLPSLPRWYLALRVEKCKYSKYRLNTWWSPSCMTMLRKMSVENIKSECCYPTFSNVAHLPATRQRRSPLPQRLVAIWQEGDACRPLFISFSHRQKVAVAVAVNTNSDLNWKVPIVFQFVVEN